MTEPAAGAPPRKKSASETWLRYTQRQFELHLVDDEDFLVALGMALAHGARNHLEALAKLGTHYRKTAGRT